MEMLSNEERAHDADSCEEQEEKVAQYRIASDHIEISSLCRFGVLAAYNRWDLCGSHILL